MKNKLIIILILVALSIAGSLAFKSFSAKSAVKDIGSGRLVGYWTMDVNQWLKIKNPAEARSLVGLSIVP